MAPVAVQPIHVAPDVGLYLKQILDLQVAGVKGILRRGEILEDAAVQLRPQRGAWTRFTEQLPFTSRTANRYRSITRHPVLRDRTYVSALPDELVILDFLSRLPADLVLAAIQDGRIHPRTTLRDARDLLAKPGASPSPGSTPWTLAHAFQKIHRALVGAPVEAHREIGVQLHELADTYGPKRTRADAHAGRSAGKPDLKLTKAFISSGLRAMASRHHPDKAGGNAEVMTQINRIAEYLRDRAGV